MGTSDSEHADYGERIERAVKAQIRAEIAASGRKQADIARDAGLYSSTLSRYLNDSEDRGLPWRTFGQIAAALGLTPHLITERAERRMKEEESLPGSAGE